MKLLRLALTVCIFIAALGCKSKPQNPTVNSNIPLPRQDENATEPSAALMEKVDGGTAEERMQQWQHEEVIRNHGLGMLGGIFGLKQRLWTYYLARALDANEESKLPPAEMKKNALALLEQFAWKDSVYRKEIALLAGVAPTPEALKLQSAAESFVSKWDDRFPNEPQLVVTREDLEKFDQESKPIMDQLMRLPTLTPKQLEEEIAALPPPTKRGPTR